MVVLKCLINKHNTLLVFYPLPSNSKIFKGNNVVRHLNRNMSESDTLDLKTGRNSVNRSRHLQCVDQINKEQSAMMRIFHSNEARFRKQYIRYEPKPPSAGTNAGNVRMFETHTPGFCYRRNGDIRQAAVSHDADNDVFLKDINELLFFNDEVDVERVVVLHLLSMQYVKLEVRFRNVSPVSYTAQRSPSPSSSGSSSKSSTTGPYEIRRSILMPVLNCVIQAAKETIQTVKTNSKIDLSEKNLFLAGTSSKFLPSYLVLPKSKDGDYDELENAFDENNLNNSPMSLKMPVSTPGDLKTMEKNLRLYVHRPIHIMIDTVLDELQSLQSDKLSMIKALVNSPSALREMLMKPEVQEFVEYLHGKPFISRGDLFHLVPAKLVVNPDKDAPPQYATNEDAKIVNAIEISESSHVALKSLIADIKTNIGNEERMKEYKQSSDKSLLLSYSLSDITVEPNMSLLQPSSGAVTLKSNDSKPSLTPITERIAIPEEVGKKPIQSQRISKDASISVDKSANIDGGFTITSYTGFSSLVNQVNPIILPTLPIEDKPKEEVSPPLPKRKPILNTKSVANEVKPTPARQDSNREKRSSKLISEIEIGILNELMRGRRPSPERPDKKTRTDRLSRVDSYHKFNTIRSPMAIAAQKESLKQKFLDEMSPFQRMHVFKKLNMIREKQAGVRDEDIPFASYVVPILNKRSIMDIANKFSEKDKKLIFLTEREGGLELPQCYTQGLGAKRPREESASRLQNMNNTVSLAEEIIVDARLTEVDVSKLKCEIAEKETHKKFLRLMSQPIPP